MTTPNAIFVGGPNGATFRNLKSSLEGTITLVEHVGRVHGREFHEVDFSAADVMLVAHPCSTLERAAARSWSERANLPLLEVEPDPKAITTSLRQAQVVTPEFEAWVSPEDSNIWLKRPDSRVPYRPVVIDDGRVFRSRNECSRALGVSASSLARALEKGGTINGQVVGFPTKHEVEEAFSVAWVPPPEPSATPNTTKKQRTSAAKRRPKGAETTSVGVSEKPSRSVDAHALVVSALEVLRSDQPTAARCLAARSLLEHAVGQDCAPQKRTVSGNAEKSPRRY